MEKEEKRSGEKEVRKGQSFLLLPVLCGKRRLKSRPRRTRMKRGTRKNGGHLSKGEASPHQKGKGGEVQKEERRKTSHGHSLSVL